MNREPENPFIDDEAQNPFINDDDDLETPTQTNSFTYPTAGNTTTANVTQREEDLERREMDIQLRESRIKQFGRNNWPSFYPLIYLDIKEEIPTEHRSTTLLAYRLWLFLVAVFVLNWVACLLLLIQGDGFESLAAASGYLLIIPLSFLLWFRPLYNALMKGHAFYYLVYLFFAGCHIVFSVVSDTIYAIDFSYNYAVCIYRHTFHWRRWSHQYHTRVHLWEDRCRCSLRY